MPVDDRRLAAAAPAWSPARQRLAERITRHDDALCRHVEACFAGLAAAASEASIRSSIGSDVAAIAGALAAAARAVTFGETATDRRAPGHPYRFGAVPTRPDGPLLPTVVHPVVAPWSDALDEAVREVLFAADMQAYFDARGNAACYRRAARHLVRAAAGAPLTE